MIPLRIFCVRKCSIIFRYAAQLYILLYYIKLSRPNHELDFLSRHQERERDFISQLHKDILADPYVTYKWSCLSRGSVDWLSRSFRLQECSIHLEPSVSLSHFQRDFFFSLPSPFPFLPSRQLLHGITPSRPFFFPVPWSLMYHDKLTKGRRYPS